MLLKSFIHKIPTGIQSRNAKPTSLLYTCSDVREAKVEKITSPLLLFYIMIFAQEFIISSTILFLTLPNQATHVEWQEEWQGPTTNLL
jgi:hypothetical protein